MRAALLLVILSLTGCMEGFPGLAERGSHPPVVEWTASTTRGPVPLRVEFVIKVVDPDPDMITVYLYDDTDDSIPPPSFRGPVRSPDVAAITYYSPGTRLVSLAVTDGTHWSNSSMEIIVEEAHNAAALLFNGTGEVTQTCPGCTGRLAGETSLVVGRYGCPDFVRGQPEGTCIWFEVLPEWEGLRFNATSSSGDPDLDFAASCQPSNPATVGHTNYPGPEDGTIPPGVGCVVLYEWEQVPSSISFKVYGSRDPE